MASPLALWLALLGMLPMLVVVVVVQAQLTPAQFTALMNVFEALACDNTSCPRFNSSTICEADCVECNGADLSELFLTGVQLTGYIPSDIGAFTALTYLDLANNSLTSSIPCSLGACTALTALFLNDNDLSGSVCSNLGQLSHLDKLALFHNDLQGFPSITFPSNPACSLSVNDAAEKNCFGYCPGACQCDKPCLSMTTTGHGGHNAAARFALSEAVVAVSAALWMMMVLPAAAA